MATKPGAEQFVLLPPRGMRAELDGASPSVNDIPHDPARGGAFGHAGDARGGAGVEDERPRSRLGPRRALLPGCRAATSSGDRDEGGWGACEKAKTTLHVVSERDRTPIAGATVVAFTESAKKVGHGAHVAGIIGARGAPPRGVRGLAPGVELRSYGVFGKGHHQGH